MFGSGSCRSSKELLTNISYEATLSCWFILITVLALLFLVDILWPEDALNELIVGPDPVEARDVALHVPLAAVARFLVLEPPPLNEGRVLAVVFELVRQLVLADDEYDRIRYTPWTSTTHTRVRSPTSWVLIRISSH